MIDPADVGHVFYGNALQTSADAIYLARHVGLRAGVPQQAGALTVNRLCGSGFQAIVSGAQEILLGGTEVALCGGHRVDEPGAARGSRRPLGSPAARDRPERGSRIRCGRRSSIRTAT